MSIVSIARLLAQTATIVRRTETTSDAEGIAITSEVRVSVRCLLQRIPVSVNEEVALGRSLPQNEWLLFLEPDVTIDANDEVIVDDARYSVLGEPELLRWPNTGRAHHIECRLKKVG